MMPDTIFPLILDNSQRSTFVRCQKMAYWKHECGLVPVGGSSNVHFAAGRAFAAGLAAARLAYWGEDGGDPFEALRAGLAALRASYDWKGPMPNYCYKTLDRMEGALAFYMEKWPFADEKLVPYRLNDGRLAVEIAHEMPLIDGFGRSLIHPSTGAELGYAMNFDLLAQHKDTGDLWIVDEKTTGKMSDAWALQWAMEAQLTGYCAAAVELSRYDPTHPQVAGAVIRGIAIHKADYAGMECLEPRQDWERRRWYRQVVRDAESWLAAHRNGTHQMAMSHACALYNNPCDYVTLCKAHDPERLIEGNFEVKRYDPLNRD